MPSSDAKSQPWSRYQEAPIVQMVPLETVPIKTNEPLRVTVVDLNMSFGSMVVFMVKWSIASIPAFLILVTPLFFLGFFLAGLAERGLP